MHDLLAADPNANGDSGHRAISRRMSGLAIGIPFLLADIGFTGLYFGGTLVHPGEVVSGVLWAASLGLPLAPLAAMVLGSVATALAVRSHDRQLTVMGLIVTALGVLGGAGLWVVSASALAG